MVAAAHKRSVYRLAGQVRACIHGLPRRVRVVFLRTTLHAFDQHLIWMFVRRNLLRTKQVTPPVTRRLTIRFAMELDPILILTVSSDPSSNVD